MANSSASDLMKEVQKFSFWLVFRRVNTDLSNIYSDYKALKVELDILKEKLAVPSQPEDVWREAKGAIDEVDQTILTSEFFETFAEIASILPRSSIPPEYMNGYRVNLTTAERELLEQMKRRPNLFFRRFVRPDGDLGPCPICLSEIRDELNTPCGHYFCKQCLESHWARNGFFCPICREPVLRLS